MTEPTNASPPEGAHDQTPLPMDLGPGRLEPLPPDNLIRIADALEKIAPALDEIAGKREPGRAHYAVPRGQPVDLCKSCGTPMVWTRTDKGAEAPLDLTTCWVVKGQAFATIHFVTCPDSRSHRRKARMGS